MEIHQLTCFHACRDCGNGRWKHPDLIAKYVLLLKRLIAEHKLYAGTLVMICIENHIWTGFLGTCQLKPALQTLIKADFDQNTFVISYALTDQGIPDVTTLQQLLQEHLYDDDPTKAISVQVWGQACSLDADHQLVMTLGEPGEEYVLDSSKPLQCKPKAPRNMPFGIKLQQKKKRTKQKNKTGSQGKSKAAAKWNLKRNQPDTEKQLELFASSDSDDGDDDDELHPVSEVQEQQGEEAKQLEEEAQKDERARALAHAAISKGASFFSAELGLGEAELAKSRRSSCFKCKLPIPVNTPRFAWQYDRKRPHAWVHGSCVASAAVQYNIAQSTLERMSRLHDSSSNDLIKNTAMQAIHDIRLAL